MNQKSKPQREKMLTVAGDLFWKKGYEGTTMRDIARACKCQPPNIYNFFPSKEAILYEILRSQMESLISSVKHLEDDETTPPVEQLRQLITGHADYTFKVTKTSKLFFDVELDSLSAVNRRRIVKMRDTYEKIFCQIIRRGIESGDFAEIDEKLAVYSIISMIVRTIIWFSPEGRLTVAQLIDFLVDFSLYGLKGNRERSTGTALRYGGSPPARFSK
jgi:AcrR family transcriptional regulator